MTTHEPLPSGTDYGRADWQNYNDYWREQDAEWLQDRLITRYSTANARLSAIPNAKPGQVTYNAATDRLEVFSAAKLNWLGVNAFLWLNSVDDQAGVTFSHRDALGRGITLRQSEIFFDLPVNNNNVLKVNYPPSSSVVLQTGTAKATITTDAASLLCDIPLSFPSLTLTGAGPTVLSTGNKNINLGTGTLSAANVAMTGTLSGNGTVNGGKGTIGGVKLGIVANQAEGSAGFVSQGGLFTGDTDAAIIKPKSGTNKIEVFSNTQDSGMIFTGGTTTFRNYLEVDHSAGVKNSPWILPTKATGAWLAPVIFSSTALNAADYPVGTIWVQ